MSEVIQYLLPTVVTIVIVLGAILTLCMYLVLAERKVSARVVSVPCFELFLAMPQDRRSATIGHARVNIAVEAGIRQGWDAIIGSEGAFVGMSGFGASAPYKDLYKHFCITAEKVAEAALAKLG